VQLGKLSLTLDPQILNMTRTRIENQRAIDTQNKLWGDIPSVNYKSNPRQGINISLRQSQIRPKKVKEIKRNANSTIRQWMKVHNKPILFTKMSMSVARRNQRHDQRK
jgi:hypothetical protein